MKKGYGYYVQKGKRLYKQVKSCKQEIAKMALKVCEIKHGGISNNYYTIKDYATDTGIPYKTLQRWVTVYKNILVKVGIEAPTDEQWNQAEKTLKLLKNKRAHSNKSNGVSKKKNTPFTKSLTNKAIQKTFNLVEEKPFVYEFERSISSAKHIKHVIKTRDLKIVDESRLLEMMTILDDASDLINIYLTKKNKRKRSVRASA